MDCQESASLPVADAKMVENDSRMIQTETDDVGGETDQKSESKAVFMFNRNTTLEEIRKLQQTFCRERNWDQYHLPRNLLLALVGEVGELSEIFQWRGEVQEGLPGWSDKEKEHVAQEMSDILIYLVRMADKCQIDLSQAVLEKFALNGKKYPAAEVFGSSKKYTEYKDKSKETT